MIRVGSAVKERDNNLTPPQRIREAMQNAAAEGRASEITTAPGWSGTQGR